MKRNCLSVFIFAVSICIGVPMQAQKHLYFKGGTLHIINSSHQDIAWMDSPEKCEAFRDENMITPALMRLRENPNFRFSVEDALSLKEYLRRHPESYDEILKYTREGRLEWGATLKQPYPSMYDGEALVRQTYYGRKWMKKILPGCDFRTAYNEDVPGVAIQLPQILAKAGIDYYQFSRHQPGLYKWSSPDGSFVLGWTPGQYECAGRPVRAAKGDQALTDSLSGVLGTWNDYFKKRGIAPHFPFLYSFDFSVPINYDSFFEQWNNDVKTGKKKDFPTIQYSTGTVALDALANKKGSKFDELCGERPNVWLYIHGPSHYRAISAARKASRALTTAEKFATILSLTENSFASYPEKELYQAWEDAIFPDHGWGGNKGAITDRLFRTKYENGLLVGNQVVEESLKALSEKISFQTKHRKAVTVYNALSWERTDPVQFTLDVEGIDNTHFCLVDTEGNNVPYQFINDHQIKGNRDEVITLLFVAQNVPAMGYKTYYLVENEKPTSTVSIPNPSVLYENNFFRMKLGKGGIASLYDKELNKELFVTDKFMGGELITLHSEGNGAGEFTDIQQPTMQGFDKLSNYDVAWQCVESGSVRDVFQWMQPFMETQATLRVVMYKTIKKVDVEVDLNGFTGENWREYRLAFPMNQTHSTVTYEVPMGTVTVGKDEIAGAAGFSKPEQIYDTPCKDVHPREVQDWFSASDGQSAVTISSDVAVFDYIDPTTSPVDYTVLQPVLLASRKSCHGLGNYYIQPGNHSYSFSLYSHEGDWQRGRKQGTQSLQPLRVAVTDTRAQKGALPEIYSFLQITGEGVVVSTLKKCEDDDSVILRCVEMDGKDTEVTFSLFKSIKDVAKTDLIEENPQIIESNSKGMKVKIGHHAIETFKLNR